MESRVRRTLPRGVSARLGFFTLPFAEPYSGAAAVLIDEFDAPGFQCSPKG
jgi:hypothetical protein